MNQNLKIIRLVSVSLNTRLKDSTYIYLILCRRDIYEEEILNLHENLEHVKHIGSRIIDDHRKES